MSEPLNFYLPPTGPSLPDFSSPPASISLARRGAETQSLDPQQTHLHLAEEHPEVERMADDWGAICEVYQQKRDFYLTVSGVRLAVGDVLTLCYPGRDVLITVIDLENGRVRVDAPAIIPRPE